MSLFKEDLEIFKLAKKLDENSKIEEDSILFILCGGTYFSDQINSEIGVNLIEFLEEEENSIKNNNFKIIPFFKLSENLEEKDILLLEKIILENMKKFNNIIIISGTDTLEYLSAYISFNNIISKIYFISSMHSRDKPNFDGIYKFKTIINFIKLKNYLKIQKGVYVITNKDLSNELFFLLNPNNILKDNSYSRNAIIPLRTYEGIILNYKGKIILNNLYSLNDFSKIKEKIISFNKKNKLNKNLEIIFINPFLKEIEFKKIIKRNNIFLILSYGCNNLPFFIYNLILKNKRKLFLIKSKIEKGIFSRNIYNKNENKNLNEIDLFFESSISWTISLIKKILNEL